jgi:hypothetical protein
MVNQNNGNGKNGNGNGSNDKEKVEISFPREEYKALEKCAENKDISVSAIIRESVKNKIHKGKVREILARACEDNKLDPESKTKAKTTLRYGQKKLKYVSKTFLLPYPS